MRRLLLLLVLASGLAVPVVAFGQDGPSPAAVAACQAEAKAIGNDAFVTKYGPTEPWGHCYQQHAEAVSTTTTTATTSDDPAAAACKAEYLALGPDAFAKKYGTPETYGNCLAAHRGATTSTTTTTTTTTAPPPKPAPDGSAKSIAAALCHAVAKEHLNACISAMLAKARAIAASCESSATSKDAYKACVTAAVGASKRR
jgi:hypothetical protein